MHKSYARLAAYDVVASVTFTCDVEWPSGEAGVDFHEISQEIHLFVKILL